MAYGLKFTSDAGELVVSSEAKVPFCLGKLQLQSTVQPTGGSGQQYPGRTAGYSIYRLWCSTPFILAYDLPQGYYVGLMGMTQVAAGVWDVKVYCGANGDAGFFDQQYPLDVWAYTFAETVQSAWGVALFDAQARLSADFSRPNVLYPRAVADLSSFYPQTIPDLVRPVAIGMPYNQQVSVGHDYANYQAMVIRSGTTLQSSMRAIQKYLAFSDESSTDNSTASGFCFLLDGSTLP